MNSKGFFFLETLDLYRYADLDSGSSIFDFRSNFHFAMPLQACELFPGMAAAAKQFYAVDKVSLSAIRGEALAVGGERDFFLRALTVDYRLPSALQSR